LRPVAFSTWRVSGWSELYPCRRSSFYGDSSGDKIVCFDRHTHCYRWKDQHGFRSVQKARQEVVSMGQPIGMLSIDGSMPGFGLRMDSVDLPVMSSWVGARLYQVLHGICCGWDSCSTGCHLELNYIDPMLMKWFQVTRLVTRTKESDLRASIRVIKTQVHNEGERWEERVP